MFDDYFTSGQPLDFDELANLMLEQGAEESPSWLHGGICGVLVGGGPQEPDYCLGLASQALGTDIVGALADYCLRLASTTLTALADEEFDFHLLLPDDEVSMEQRLQSLGSWCSAFLAGYALSVEDPGGDALGREAGDILKDMAAIAQVGLEVEDDEDEEGAERNYFELTEYLRFACLNLFLEEQAHTEEKSE